MFPGARSVANTPGVRGILGSMAPRTVTVEQLLAHAAWLRRLAHGLVRGDAAAEDLVQETWIAALRRPPEPGAPLRPWLATVLRNLFLMRARSEGRRLRREEGEADEAAFGRAPSSPEDLVGRLETERRLAELVLALDEPYRSTVVYRYWEGLSAAEIARLQDVPAGTVRWRLKTGLDRLRAALDADVPGGRARWIVLFAPIASAPRVASGATIGKGFLLAKKSLTIAVALALLVAGGAALLVRGQAAAPTPPDERLARGAPTPRPRAQTTRPPGAPPTEGPIVPARAAIDPAARGGAFEGRVLNWSLGTGVEGAEVTFAHAGGSTALQTEAGGRFGFAPEVAGGYRLASVTAPGFLPFAPEWGHSPIALQARPGTRVSELVVYLTPAVDYTGVVQDPGGRPVAGAEVRLYGAGAGEQALSPIRERFRSDARGEFVFHAPDDALLEARHAAFGPGRAHLDGAAQTSHRLVIVLAPRNAEAARLGRARIEGNVVDADGAPIAGAVVQASFQAGREGKGVPHPSPETTTDDEGRFSLEGLDPGPHTLRARQAGAAPVEAAAAAPARGVTLRLSPGAGLAGQVVDPAGAPIPSFTIAVLRRRGLASDLLRTLAVVDAEGRFSIGDLAPGEYRVVASAFGRAPGREVPAQASIGVPTPVRLALSGGGRLTGTVTTSKGGEPLPHARVSAEGALASGSNAVPLGATTTTDAGGRFQLEGLPPGQRSIVVGAYGHHMRIVGGLAIVDGQALGPLAIVLDPTAPGETPRLELAGIGAKLTAGEDALVVEGVLPGGSALEAGLAPGDGIVTVDGQLVSELGFDRALQLIRGAEGTVVRLGVRKAAGGAPVELSVTRRRIRA
jgi:RNA polymerase sigma factor (sigma-70 family)